MAPEKKDYKYHGFVIRMTGRGHYVILGKPRDMTGPKSSKTLAAAKTIVDKWEKRQYRRDKVTF